jgi:hypothetical protein
MRTVAGLTAVVLLVFVTAGCHFTVGADEPGKKWIALLDKHKALLKQGKFDAKAFQAEAKPIAEDLKKHRGSNPKVYFSDKVLADFKRAMKEFEDLMKEKGTPEQQKAYLDMRQIWDFEQPAANAPANAPANGG